MTQDFTLNIYQQLLESLLEAKYAFQTFEEFINAPKERAIILRHDVDLKAINSLHTAHIEQSLGIKASYYFRVVPESNQPEIIKAIAELGHEIGYHYEDLSLMNGVKDKAILHFEDKLNYFRKFYPVKTVCMHGSPTSKIDNRSIWEYFNYKDYGVIGEPYFDIDFDKVFYLTDTGRCWDGERYSIRDKVNSNYKLSFHSTDDIINAAQKGELPSQLMITTHPQRWTDNTFDWWKERIMQSAKNSVKQMLIKLRK